jgi:hypothetical protein
MVQFSIKLACITRSPILLHSWAVLRHFDAVPLSWYLASSVIPIWCQAGSSSFISVVMCGALMVRLYFVPVFRILRSSSGCHIVRSVGVPAWLTPQSSGCRDLGCIELMIQQGGRWKSTGALYLTPPHTYVNTVVLHCIQ